MEKIRNSIIAKTIAFIIAVACVAVAALSAVIIVFNIGSHWYSSSDAAIEKDIYNKTSTFAASRIAQYVHMTGSGEISEEDELIYGEKEIIDSENNFGYVVTITDENLPITFVEDGQAVNSRTLNNKLVNSPGAYHSEVSYEGMDIDVYFATISEGNVPEDIFRIYQQLSTMHDYGDPAIAAAAACIIIFILMMVFLISSVGREKGKESMASHLPIEIAIVLAVAAAAILVAVNEQVLWDITPEILCALAVMDAVIGATVILGFILILSIKIKTGTVLKNSLCCMMLRLVITLIRKTMGLLIFFVKKTSSRCGALVKGIPIVWKSAAIGIACIFANFLLLLSTYAMGGFGWLLWTVGAILTEGFIIYIALGMKKLKEAGRSLANGEFDRKIDTKELFLDLKEHGEDLNSISEGMTKAVEERMKSERFKTELITNVSHDIKTPLTSIINYVDLLASEGITDEKTAEYIDVLDRQSKRLKKLTDDLVEASKAATGTVKLDMIPCKVAVLMSQACGEYDSKMEDKQLKLISDISDENAEIMADGRSMWRIFDNILNNICKYSQPGTRVYQSMVKKGDNVLITYKNTSAYQLNISEEQLMERFVRGDSSRHTEGSGLGLSIAKNLTELQGGSFKISIDGDLFKVMVEFPQRR